MAIDSENQRGSVLSLMWDELLPFPDSSINQYDRQQTIGIYRGFVNDEGTEEPEEPVGSIWVNVTENNTVTWSAI